MQPTNGERHLMYATTTSGTDRNQALAYGTFLAIMRLDEFPGDR
jgi:hypothetical protein